MCSAPCAAVTARGGVAAQAWFHGGRLLGYAAAGAVVATSAGALAGLAQTSPVLRPLWTLLQAGALALGLWLLWHGRQPLWLAGRNLRPAPAAVSGAGGWQRLQGPLRAGAAGSLWVAWPCGLLHSALLVAAMTESALSGAAAMAGFALLSAAGLLWAPWLWRRIGRAGGGQRAERLAARLAGAMLVAASGWALGHGLWHRVAVYCGWA
jgi:sulfite exporter TauE/SafE